MEYWNNIIAEKSWNILQELKKEKFEFILIGGWAAYLLTKMSKSKDIDIVIKNLRDLEYLRKKFRLSKNNSLKKYEIKIEEIDIDIYVPFFSKLAIPVEEIRKHTIRIENFEIPKPELLIILKQAAEEEREHSVRGEKDRIDIVALVFSGIDFKEYSKLLKQYGLEDFRKRLKNILLDFRDFRYFNLTPAQFKRRKKEILGMLKKNST